MDNGRSYTCGIEEVYRTSLHQRLSFAVSIKLLVNSIKNKTKQKTRDFSGGPIVKNLCFHWRIWAWVRSPIGELRSSCCMAQSKKTKPKTKATSKNMDHATDTLMSKRSQIQKGTNFMISCIWSSRSQKSKVIEVRILVTAAGEGTSLEGAREFPRALGMFVLDHTHTQIWVFGFHEKGRDGEVSRGYCIKAASLEQWFRAGRI